jgi:hypothetical protein
MDTEYARYEVECYSVTWTSIDDIPSCQLAWLNLEYLSVRVQRDLGKRSNLWDILVGHAVSHYDVWIARKEFVQI